MVHITGEHNEQLRMMHWIRLKVCLVWAYRGRPRYHSSDRPEPRCVIGWLMESGGLTVHGTRSGGTQVRAGQWIFPAADMDHFEFTADAAIVSLRFHAHWPNGTPLFVNDRPVIVDADQFPELTGAAERLVTEANRAYGKKQSNELGPEWVTSADGTDGEIRDFSLESLDLLYQQVTLEQQMRMDRAMRRWLVVYARAMTKTGVARSRVSRSDDRVAQAMAIINDHPPERPLDESALGREVGLSVSQLNRLFVPQVGLTPRDYFQQRRLELAKSTLLSQKMAVKRVAYLLGFGQPSHFCHWFKARAGVTPGQFMKGYTQPSQLVE